MLIVFPTTCYTKNKMKKNPNILMESLSLNPIHNKTQRKISHFVSFERCKFLKPILSMESARSCYILNLPLHHINNCIKRFSQTFKFTLQIQLRFINIMNLIQVHLFISFLFFKFTRLF